MNLLNRFLTLDRRWVFLFMALAILLPLIFHVSIPFSQDKDVVAIYDKINELPEGSPVLVSCDYDPGSKPELQPFNEALLYYLMHRRLIPVVMCLWPGAPPLVQSAFQVALKQVEEHDGRRPVEHVDYVNLGYKEGKQFVMLAIGTSIREAFPVDYTHTSIDSIPAMKGVESLSSFPLFVNISAGSPGTKEWVQTVQNRYNITMASSCTAVMAPDNIPYVQSKQLIGLAGGMKGSADFEQLVYKGTKWSKTGMATIGMSAQSFGHLVIIIFIILGNIAFFLTRRER
jgi:hypothetical protein